jgi:hypothetical protein
LFWQVPLDSSRIKAEFHIEYRQKGLLWFSTYRVMFEAENTGSRTQQAASKFLSSACRFRQRKPCTMDWHCSWMEALAARSGEMKSQPGRWCLRAQRGPLKAIYHSRDKEAGDTGWPEELVGMRASQVSQENDFHLVLRTDFAGFDFPENSLAYGKAGERERLGNPLGLSESDFGLMIALKMPEKLQPDR